jgi:hypothetical protein
MAEGNLADVIRRIVSDAASEHRGARIRIWIVVVLLVVVAGYMGWIYSSIGKLDATLLTQRAREKMQDELPGFRLRLADEMIAKAPMMVEHGVEQIRKAPPLLSRQVESMVTEKTKGMLLELEDQLDAELRYDLEERLRELKTMGKDRSPREQIEAVLDQVQSDYRTRMEGLVDEMYVQYADEIGAVNEFLTRLQSAPDLSPRERIQKDIIQATVALRAHFVDVEEPSPDPAEAGK